MSDRHIYNNSGQSWTFEATGTQAGGSGGTQLGNVYFSGAGSGNAQNGPWVLPAQSVVAIQYTTSGGTSSGYWNITDHNGKMEQFPYESGVFGQDPSIGHNGDTGAANLNDPADGDISMGGDNW